LECLWSGRGEGYGDGMFVYYGVWEFGELRSRMVDGDDMGFARLITEPCDLVVYYGLN
jgi:hypothetical protein